VIWLHFEGVVAQTKCERSFRRKQFVSWERRTGQITCTCAKNFAEILTKRYLSNTQVEESQVPFEGEAHSNSARHIPIKTAHAD
jgi:hypothetical protein